MRKYDKYKPSGIEWVGETPEHWHLIKLKYLSYFEKGKNAATYTSEYIGRNWGEFPVYSGQTEHEGVLGTIDTYDYDLPNALLVTTVGAKAMSLRKLPQKFSLSQNCALIVNRDNRFNVDFYYYYLLRHFEFEKGRISLIMQPSLRFEDLNSYDVYLPAIKEQTAIANLLDEKTTKIDKLITNKQKLIELLKEERTAIINQAVTRGINPKVKLKTSGIDWLGVIPAHWQVKKFKYLCSIISKGTTPSTVGSELLNAGEIKFLKAENILPSNTISSSPEFFIDENTNNLLKRSELKENDVLIVIAGATIGKVGILLKEFIPANTNQAVCFIRLRETTLVKWLWLFLQSHIIKQIIALASVQAAQPNLSMENIGNFLLLIPQYDEIENIVNFIETETKRIDNTASKIEKEIDLLQEYRTALISEVVIGKIKVI